MKTEIEPQRGIQKTTKTQYLRLEFRDLRPYSNYKILTKNDDGASNWSKVSTGLEEYLISDIHYALKGSVFSETPPGYETSPDGEFFDIEVDWREGNEFEFSALIHHYFAGGDRVIRAARAEANDSSQMLDALSTMIAYRIHPSLKDQYVQRDGEAHINPDYVPSERPFRKANLNDD